ncbi:hypothetical protein B0I27_103136 [Arcticibacter pallidicorallinus]|uniref:Glycosyltransferase 2-like domain-containing protein n=2 Tax=Arcticibacter pallidicorallinus TaxID=1259464 RepID=A0A2T0U6X0_9SPHI|nr:hypothetical protein B0I27_103136 [Arcticibacter pallidicorallinus]
MTSDCIESIYRYTRDVTIEVIVVDNSSSDGSAEAIPARFHDITFIKNAENVGFGRANNAGANVASGNYLFFLNSDTVLTSNAVKSFYEFMERSSEEGIAGCGGRLVDRNHKTGISFGNFPTYREIYWSLGLRYIFPVYFSTKLASAISPGAKVPLSKVAFISGADLFLRKDIFYSVGMFDKDFFMYCEEAELAFRIAAVGYKLCYLPSVTIIHLEGGSQRSSDGFSKTKYRMSMTSRLLFFQKCYGSRIRRKVKRILIMRAVVEGIVRLRFADAFCKIRILKQV